MSHAESSLFLIWQVQDQMDSNYKEYARTNTRLHDFKNRVINDWNSLPPHIINASDITIFKALLDEHWICNTVIQLILFNCMVI